jgi:hypothetical protein
MFFDLFHTHYWGPPRRREDGVHYMTCYECGKRRKLKVDIDDQANKRLTVMRQDKAARAA